MDAVGAASWIVQVVLEKLIGDGIDAAWAAAASGSDADPSSDVRRLRSRLQSLHLVLSAAQERVPRARHFSAPCGVYAASLATPTTCSTKCSITRSTASSIRTRLVTLLLQCQLSNQPSQRFGVPLPRGHA
jgi:hypothetical protein